MAGCRHTVDTTVLQTACMTASPMPPAVYRNSTNAGLAERDLWPTVAVIAVIGFVLRLCASAGDISLDEIWTHELLVGITSVDQVLWKVSHDNNHFLNSAWLYFTGPDASPPVQRALSIVLGTASVFAATAVTADRGRTTQLIAALLFAVSYPMVQFGSEARGYAGLVLFSLLAIWAVQRRLDGLGNTLVLSAVILMGFLSHLTMAATVLSLVIWAFWVLHRRGHGLRTAVIGTVRIFLPPFIALLPLAGCMAYAAWNYGVTIGGVSPFSVASFFSGYGKITAFLLGAPNALPYWVFVVLAFGTVLLSAKVAPNRRTLLYSLGAIGFPLVLLAMRLPNLEFPRYYTLAVIMLMLATSEMIGQMLEAGGRRRISAALVLVLYLCSNGLSLWRFLEFGRGSYADVVAEMNWEPNAEYAASSAFRIQKITNFYQRHSENKATIVRTPQLCEKRPEWYVEEVWEAEPYENDFVIPECDLIYDIVMFNRGWGLTGVGWALYRLRY